MYFKKIFICLICDKKLCNKYCLKRHYITHIKIKTHICSICFKMFTRKDNLTQHINRVHYIL